MTAYNVGMMIPWRRLVLYAARKIAENPEARAQTADIVQQARREAKRIADSPSRARAAGQTVRRVGEQLRRRLQSDD